MNLAHLLARAAYVRPEAPAIFYGTRLIATYGQLMARVGALAHTLRVTVELQPGDRVAICMTNTPAYLEVMYGIWAAGLVAVPINAKLHPKEVRFILDDCGAAALFVSGDIAASLAGTTTSLHVWAAGTREYERLFATANRDQRWDLVPRDASDLAWLFYTSGTTGRPKGVMLSNRNLLAMTSCYFMDVHAATAEDSAIYAAPLSHGAGLYSFPHVATGAKHVVPESGGFEPAELCRVASHHRGACLFAAPTMVKRLVDHIDANDAPTDGFSTIVYGGGPMYVELIERALEVMGNRFVQIYGQGESPMTITALSRAHLADRTHPRYRQRIASVGIAQTLVEVRTVADNGEALPAGEVGEVVVRGDVVMQGYWNNPRASAETLRDGWLHTGDVGSFDQDGFLTLKDRSRDVIISGGANIYPREVEEVLLAHPDVDEVSVVGRPNIEWGEEVVAFVVTKHGARMETKELDALCLASLARFKRPRDYRFVGSLPKNNYGKVLKTALREMLDVAQERDTQSRR